MTNISNQMSKHASVLGKTVRDKVTGFEGVADSISFDLYGCVQYVVNPKVDKDGKAGQGKWFDVTRLEIIDNTPVMELPDFDAGYIAEGRKGAAHKTLPGE